MIYPIFIEMNILEIHTEKGMSWEYNKSVNLNSSNPILKNPTRRITTRLTSGLIKRTNLSNHNMLNEQNRQI